MSSRLLLALGTLVLIAGLAACDAGFDGDRQANLPPSTELAVRDTSLVENLCSRQADGRTVCTEDDDLFVSTVFVAWSGTDPDGFVVSFDLRYYDERERPGPEELWTSTTRRDTLILLPIPPGQTTANVVFEVRAVDNEGAKDPRPARTVFPIVNSPPSVRLVPAEAPPDTTWTVFSVTFEATDPDGPDDLLGVEVAFNDSDSFVRLPPDARFVTFVGERAPPGAATTPARVFLGRGFNRTEILVPNLRLDADNTLYLRAVDRTETASPTVVFPSAESERTWFVRQPKSEILLVNDFRSTRANQVIPFHADVLAGYTGGAGVDVWDLTRPNTPPASATQYSDALPPVYDPVLRETLRLWRYIYWVSDSVTDGVRGNNLALAATFLDRFLEDGGRMFVQVPFTTPPAGEIEFDNPAYDLLPSESIVVGPTNVPPSLALPVDARVEPVEPVPGTGRTLPPLVSRQFVFALPYTLNFATATPLYRAEFIDRDAGGTAWEGAPFVASMDAERRVGLLALQLYTRNQLNFTGPDGDPNAPRLAVQYMLEGLGFPGAPQE